MTFKALLRSCSALLRFQEHDTSAHTLHAVFDTSGPARTSRKINANLGVSEYAQLQGLEVDAGACVELRKKSQAATQHNTLCISKDA